MSTSAASTEPSVDSNVEENLSAPLWKYVTKDIVVDADGVARAGGGNVTFTCSFCEKRFNGSHSRVEAHFLKIPRKGIKPCTKVTQAKMQEMQQLLDWCAQQLRERAPNKVPLPPSSSFSGSGSSYFPLMERDDEAKKRRVSPQLAKAFKIEDRQQCDAEIARLFYSSGLSFNVARNPLYRSSYTRASNIPGYVPLGYNALRTTLLDNERRHVEQTLEPVKKTWKETGVSLCSDGWTDGQKRPLINMMAAATNKAMMLRAVNCDGTTKDKTEISKLLLASINEIGSENVVQVVTDNAPVCAAAGAMVEEAHPHIFWTPCVVHTLNLVLKDTLKAKAYLPGENVEKELGWLMDVCNDVWFIKNFIVNHNMRLSMYNDNCALKLLQVAETRFASHYVMLKRFRDVKNSMQQMVISPRWDMYREDDVKKARAVKEMLLSDTLWEQIDFMIAFMSPIYEMIRIADLDKPCLHLVYEWWDTMIEKVKKAIYTPEFANVLSIHCDASRFYDVVYSTLIARWTKSSTSLYCMAHSLNPKYYSSQWLEEDLNWVAPHRDTELTNERRRCLIKLYPDPQVRNKVMEEYGYFSLNMGDYSRPDALENKFYFEPLIWWASYGASTPRLQSLALRLVNQPCSSSCCEINWSTYSFIQGLKRNKLEPKRAQDLVYVHTNLRLLAKAEPTYYKDRDSMWDLTGDGHESMEPGINDDVLELAELSLDEPALERMLVNDEMDY
ncbi:uncharacterized protein LOC126796890 [Argentina anserina]|uniref:uncharacterized protein LOC126796890 n=1 Tax=Argentina anserina TaxID=57926 RepID=UPI00217653DE|nr:uncharacterized protein LOC126796890 [Potentilla anserina]